MFTALQLLVLFFGAAQGVTSPTGLSDRVSSNYRAQLVTRKSIVGINVGPFINLLRKKFDESEANDNIARSTGQLQDRSKRSVNDNNVSASQDRTTISDWVNAMTSTPQSQDEPHRSMNGNNFEKNNDQFSSRDNEVIDQSEESSNRSQSWNRNANDAGIVHTINMYLALTLGPALAISGLVSNLINVAVFSQLGIQEGVTLNFLILSLSDGFLVATLFTTNVYNCLSFTGLSRTLPLAIEFTTTKRILGMAKNMPTATSMITTTVIAVVRCCCVTIPLDVRRILTARRQMAVIMLLSSTVTAIYIYVASDRSLGWVWNAKLNISQIAFVNSDEEASRTTLFHALRNWLFYSCICINLVSVIILITALKKASRFRSLTTTFATSGNPKSAATGEAEASKSSQRENKKEVNVVKCVVLVLILFIVCNIPTVINSLMELFDVSYSFTLKQFTVAFAGYFNLINVNCNIFVYYSFNSNYRRKLLSFYKGASE